MHILTRAVSITSKSSSGTSIVSMLAVIAARVLSTSIAVSELITPAALLTKCCPTSKTAIVMSKTWVTR